MASETVLAVERPYVPDAHPFVLEAADLVVTTTGGNGAVRELCEFILEKRENG